MNTVTVLLGGGGNESILGNRHKEHHSVSNHPIMSRYLGVADKIHHDNRNH